MDCQLASDAAVVVEDAVDLGLGQAQAWRFGMSDARRDADLSRPDSQLRHANALKPLVNLLSRGTMTPPRRTSRGEIQTNLN